MKKPWNVAGVKMNILEMLLVLTHGPMAVVFTCFPHPFMTKANSARLLRWLSLVAALFRLTAERRLQYRMVDDKNSRTVNTFFNTQPADDGILTNPYQSREATDRWFASCCGRATKSYCSCNIIQRFNDCNSFATILKVFEQFGSLQKDWCVNRFARVTVKIWRHIFAVFVWTVTKGLSRRLRV